MAPAASPRLAAARVLSAILDEGRALDDALAQAAAFEALEGRDRAFARALISAALRRLGGLDAVLAHCLERPLPQTATLARALLRIGAADLLVLGAPAHAGVSEAVSCARSDRASAGFANLINAVLRRVAREGEALLTAQAPGADLPAWLFTRWRAAYGEAADALARALANEPPRDLTVRADAAGWAARLGGMVTPTGSVRLLPGAGAVAALDGYEAGEWWVQDAAAALPARLLGDVRGRAVLDLCAAPGGKTMQLAAAGARVTALDISASRLARLGRNLARARLTAELVCADALTWSAPAPFDAVLLDAPCTATGTIRRHPDLPWLRRPTDIPKLADLQQRLLARAGDFVKPGGVLVYAVCSLEPEEGEAVIAVALASGAWRRAPIQAGEVAGAGQFITPAGDLRTLPSHWPEIGGLDGFYAARLVRH